MNKNSIFWRLFLPFVFVSSLGFILAVLNIPDILEKNVVMSAVQTAENNVRQFKVLRKYYVKYVIKKVLKGSDLKASFNHRNDPNAIPLPATLIHDLSEELSEAGTSLKLYSLYPFPNRAERVNDEFANSAWQALSKNVEQTFSQVETINNRVNVRVAVADTMVSDACVSCHNTHPQTPKNDWKLGDLRGVLEINIPIDDQLAAGRRLSNIIVGSIIAGMLVITAIFFFSYRIFIQRKLSHINSALSGIARGEGDLTQRLDEKGEDEISQIATSFNLFMEKLHSTISGFVGAVNDLVLTADQVVQGAREASEDMKALQSQTDQAATAITEMTASISEVATNAQSTAKTAVSAEERSGEGRQIVAKASLSINNLAGEMEKASDVIQSVRHDSDSIGREQVNRAEDLLWLQMKYALWRIEHNIRPKKYRQ